MRRPGPWLLFLLKVGIAAGLIAWLSTGPLNFRQLLHVPFSAQLVALGVILFLSMLLPAIRWWALLKIQQIEVSLWQVTKMTWVGYVTAVILPGAASGDLAKGFLIARGQPQARARSLSTVLVDRLIGVYSLILLGSLSAGWMLIVEQPTGVLRTTCILLLALLAATSLGLVAVAISPLGKLLARFAPSGWVEACTESIQLYRESKVLLAVCLVLSLVSSAFTAASLAAADRVLGGSVSWSASLAVGPIVVLANAIPLTPGGIGVAEAASSELFGQVGSTNGAEMMLAIRLVMAVLSLPALLILLTRPRANISSSPQSGSVPPDDALIVDSRQSSQRAA